MKQLSTVPNKASTNNPAQFKRPLHPMGWAWRSLLNFELWTRSIAIGFRSSRGSLSCDVTFGSSYPKSGSLQDKQCWSTLKAAGDDGRQCTIPVTRDDMYKGNEHTTNMDKAPCFGRHFFCKTYCQKGSSAIRSSALSKAVRHCSHPSEIPPSHVKGGQPLI